MSKIRVVVAENDLDYEHSAMLLTVSDPWVKLGRTFEYSYAKVRNKNGELFVAKEDAKVIGCLLLEMNSTLKAFIRALCVSAEYRGKGVEEKLLAFAERRVFRETTNVFVFASTSEKRAFYKDHGYEEVGKLADMYVRGTDESIMRKTSGPIGEMNPNKVEIIVLDGDSETLEDAIRFAGKELYELGLVKENYAEKCIEREKVFSTGLPTKISVAIPHTDPEWVNYNCLCFQRMKKPVTAIEIGGTEKLSCSVVINMGITGEGNQVTMLSKIIEAFQDEEFVRACSVEEETVVKKLVENCLSL